MNAYEWLSQTASGNETPPATESMHEEQEATKAGLNFMSAIDAHVKWKSQLESRIDEGGDEVQVETVSRDDQCTLGRWIYGLGAERFGKLDAFEAMRAEHARFHACAGRALAASRRGAKADALDMLDHGDYARTSRQVKILLARLYVQIAENEGKR